MLFAGVKDSASEELLKLKSEVGQLIKSHLRTLSHFYMTLQALNCVHRGNYQPEEDLSRELRKLLEDHPEVWRCHRELAA